LVGRSADASLRIEHSSVSRLHAEVVRDADGIWIRDRGSANGTRIDGQLRRVGERAQLRRGTLVEIGDAVIVLECEDGSLTDVPTPSVSSPPADNLALQRLVARLAMGRMPVVILGETGVGKRRFAEAIHAQSSRARGPFLQANCSSFSPEGLDVELLGHDAGYLGAAVGARRGLLESAAGGSVLLTEVGDMSLDSQARLLRALEFGVVQRLGGGKSVPLDVRLLVTSHRDLPAMVGRGEFRGDLYHRLCGALVEVPPLRRRLDDLAPLGSQLLRELSAVMGRRAPALTAEALDCLRRHSWPGNVRELRNTLEVALLMCDGESLEAEHLPTTVLPSASGAHSLRNEIDALERERIVRALEYCEGNQTRAAATLGMPRRTLIAKLERYGLPRPRKP